MGDTAVFEQLPSDLMLGDATLQGMYDTFGHGLLTPGSSAPTSPMPQGHLDLMTNNDMTLDPNAPAQDQTISSPPQLAAPPPIVYPRPGETTLTSPASWLTPSGNALPLAAAVSAARTSDPAVNPVLLKESTKLSIAKQLERNLDRELQLARENQAMKRMDLEGIEVKAALFKDIAGKIDGPLPSDTLKFVAMSFCPRESFLPQPNNDDKENRDEPPCRVVRSKPAPAKPKTLLTYHAPPSDTESSDADDFQPQEIKRIRGRTPLPLPAPRVIRVSPPSSPEVGMERLNVSTPTGKRKAPDATQMYKNLMNKHDQTTKTILDEVRKKTDDLRFEVDTQLGIVQKKFEKLKPLETVILYVFALQNYHANPPINAVTKTIVTRSGNGMPGFPVAVKTNIGGKAIHAFDLLAIIRLATNAELRINDHHIQTERLSIDAIKKDLATRFKSETDRARNTRLEPTASIFMRGGTAKRNRDTNLYEAKVMRHLTDKDTKRAEIFHNFPDARLNDKDKGEPDLMLLIYPGVGQSHGWNTLSQLQQVYSGITLNFLSIVSGPFPPLTMNKKDTPMVGFDE